MNMNQNMCRSERNIQTTGRQILMLCLLIIASGGCHGTSLEEPEHHTPAHKPADFPAAVDRLLALHNEIANNGTRAADPLDAFSESFDIARWLPELAADSDMEERPWNQVHEIARQMETILTNVLSHDVGERRGTYLRYEVDLVRHQRALSDIKQQLQPPPAHW
jgi:hypothetical protein